MRKIKLMALLLAALMIVTAFAGCASVKKDEFDALDVRVQALEGLLKDQQTALEDIKGTIAENDNSDVLAAIDALKKELDDKIQDVNDRVDDSVGTTTEGVSAETKTAQQQALALIEVRRAEFAKAVNEYSTEDYKKISEALGTATGAVNAATTKTAVDAAMAALDAELGKYMTYAMKGYDYYTRLLGNVNADAKDLVEEAKAFLKEVKAVFGEDDVAFTGTLYHKGANQRYNESDKAPAHIAELAYLVSEESSEARDVYLDVYNTINDLCNLYTSTKNTHAPADAVKVYCVVEEDGEKDLEVAELYTLAAYTVWAEELVYDIDKKFGEPLIYKGAGYNEIGAKFDEYEEFVDGAMILGGDKLVNLVTNNDKIVAAEVEYENLEKAAEDFWTATKVKTRVYDHVFYYYEVLKTNNAATLLSTVIDGEEIFVADYYAKVEATLAEWKAAYGLSDENVLAIIEKSEYESGKTLANKITGFKFTGKLAGDESYTKDKLTNDLLVVALNTFKNDIAPKIADINATVEADVSVDSALKYNEVEEAIKDLLILQKASVEKDAEYPANVNITLTAMANIEYMVRESKVFPKYADLRFDKFDKGATEINNAFIKANIVDLYTFEPDVDALADYFVVDDTTDTVTKDDRTTGEVYAFFKVGGTYDAINTKADYLNGKIEEYADKAAKGELSTNIGLVELEGKYVKLAGSETFTSGKKTFVAADNVYVLVNELNATSESYKTYMNNVIAGTNYTIECFKFQYPGFVSMLDLDVFKATYDTMVARMDTLFAGATEIINLVAAIDYVPVAGTDLLKDKVDVKFYTDDNKDGVYTEGEDTIVSYTIADAQRVSLNDYAAIKAAATAHGNWAKLGGAINISAFDKFVDTDGTEYADVFYVKTLNADADKLVAAIDLYQGFNLIVDDLATKANKFANDVTTVENINKYNAFSAKLSNNNIIALDATKAEKSDYKSTNFYAVTGVSDTTVDNTSAKKYTVVKIGDTQFYTDTVIVKTTVANVGEALFNGGAKTKIEILNSIVAKYDAFAAANVEFKSNKSEDGKTVYYQLVDGEGVYAPYAKFDDAAKKYIDGGYDIAAVKGYIFDTTSGKTSDKVYNAFRQEIETCKTVAEIANVIKSYAAKNAGFTVTLAGIDAYTVETLVEELI